VIALLILASVLAIGGGIAIDYLDSKEKDKS